MLEITVPAAELWDEINNQFIYTKKQTLRLEHSLVSLSKWESKWCKPFLSKTDKTTQEIIDYVKCMTLTQNVPDEVYMCLTADNLREIDNYINAPMTATWFSKEDKPSRANQEQVTSELIYYWMIAFGIPCEYQKWHINRLLTLIRICNIKNQPPKKMSKRDIMSRNAALNAARRNQLHTKG
ncbi:MAG: hypothetical protein MR912_08995 [Prevotella sp.]|nr:hypothetical protein [Prevotella sp.]